MTRPDDLSPDNKIKMPLIRSRRIKGFSPRRKEVIYCIVGVVILTAVYVFIVQDNEGRLTDTTTAQKLPQQLSSKVDKGNHQLLVGIRNIRHENESRNTTKRLSQHLKNPNIPKTNYITINFLGRLGNLLFQYASLIGIARENNLIPLVSSRNELRKIFKISSETIENKVVKYGKVFRESRGGCTFDKRAMTLERNHNYKLDGYFQSWKYFTDAAAEVKREFTFKDSVLTKAKSQFNTLTAHVQNISGMTYIAVHLRRGDMVHTKHFVNYGYISPGVDYMKRAMDYFRSKFPNRLFIFASDDIKWCKENLSANDVRFVPMGNSRDVDMAIMMQCDHMVMSVGSFGWWTAWLINGTTVYYKDYPKAGSNLAKELVPEDYRPPHWIGM